jgi:hypothetical protein
MGTVTNSLITIPIILDQAIGYCSEYFGSGSLLLFPLFWMKLLSTFPIILEQAVGYCSYYFGLAVGYCSHYFGSGC